MAALMFQSIGKLNQTESEFLLQAVEYRNMISSSGKYSMRAAAVFALVTLLSSSTAFSRPDPMPFVSIGAHAEPEIRITGRIDATLAADRPPLSGPAAMLV